MKTKKNWAQRLISSMHTFKLNNKQTFNKRFAITKNLIKNRC